MTTGQRSVESAEEAARHIIAFYWASASRDAMYRYIEERDAHIRAAERAPLEARIASLEGDIRFLLGQADRHNIAMCKAQDDKDAALARAQRAEDALKNLADRVEWCMPRWASDQTDYRRARDLLATHRTATGGQAE